MQSGRAYMRKRASKALPSALRQLGVVGRDKKRCALRLRALFTSKASREANRSAKGTWIVVAAKKGVVAKGGIEPPTQGFSVLCSTN